MNGYAKLCIRKIMDDVTLGIPNESCRMCLDLQRVIGRNGLLRAIEI